MRSVSIFSRGLESQWQLANNLARYLYPWILLLFRIISVYCFSDFAKHNTILPICWNLFKVCAWMIPDCAEVFGLWIATSFHSVMQRHVADISHLRSRVIARSRCGPIVQFLLAKGFTPTYCPTWTIASWNVLEHKFAPNRKSNVFRLIFSKHTTRSIVTFVNTRSSRTKCGGLTSLVTLVT